MNDPELIELLNKRKFVDASPDFEEKLLMKAFATKPLQEIKVKVDYLDLDLDLEELFMKLFSFRMISVYACFLIMSFSGVYSVTKSKLEKEETQASFAQFLYPSGGIL